LREPICHPKSGAAAPAAFPEVHIRVS
jgi:hypothetical protein